jgi:tetratricopeptide (TPR) repeat protein
LYNNALSLCEGSKCTESPKAIEYLTEAIRLQPDFANAYGARGNAYGNQRQYQLALEDYNKAILLKPDKSVFFNNRGNVYKDLNKYPLAIEDYNQAIRLKPDNAEAYHNRGNAYFIQGNKSLGCSDAQKVCELGNCQLLEWAKDKKYCR